MANYDEWNKAIAEYFVKNLPSGSTVYLSVDDETLMDIGVRFAQSETDSTNWVEDFKKAVQTKCTYNNVVLPPLRYEVQSDKFPNSVAFLAAMVLAAHYMVREEEGKLKISSTAYFKRLRQVLGISDGNTGRPEGLKEAGSEVPSWEKWNRWLIGNGWLYSAEQGEGGYNKFINYPLSQALLREADQQALEHRFREYESQGELSRFSDKDTINSWVRKQQFGSKHLRELIHESDFRRFEAVTDAVFEVFSSIDWDQDSDPTNGKKPILKRRMKAELYRDEDVIMGNITYFLYPRQPRQYNGERLTVFLNGSDHPYPLQEERQGWFMPLFPVNPSGGLSYEVKGHPQIRELVLPERNFWILVPDPDNETSGVFAGWKKPGLGEYFILLCRKEYMYQMMQFRQQDLIKWDADYPIDKEWVEFQGCMINTLSWEDIKPEYPDLYEALKPRITATISLKGGLRVPNHSGWLQGYLPKITIFAFDDSISLKLVNNSTPDEVIMEKIVKTNKPMSIPSLEPGVYLFGAHSSEKIVAQRSIQILLWDSLDSPQPKQPFNANIGTCTMRGAFITNNEKT